MTSTYKTVVVHANDERRADRLIGFAAEFAENHGAHLIGLYVVPLPVLDEWPDIAVAEMIEDQRRAFREEGERVGKMFRDKTKLMSKPAEWRLVESQYATVTDGIVQTARAADIVIVAQADKDWRLTSTLDKPENVVMESGRPVLVVPNAGSPRPDPRKIMVAWNGRRESTRAVFDALPLLERASAVNIVWIDAVAGSAPAGDLPGTELAAALSRHGVNAQIKPVAADEESVGMALLQESKRCGADLVVMGAYGHSRFREFLLGGATHNLMRNMTLPVLFSH